MKFSDDINKQIYMPNRNEETFIRRDYYGGYADTFIPSDEFFYYYDVNSLYPHVMKNYKMPFGAPVWCNNLYKLNLNTFFGFIEAYVECPGNIMRPFLPYRDKNNILLFPTGNFVGVYYSEELKHARDFGYQIAPLRHYLFESLDIILLLNFSHIYIKVDKKLRYAGIVMR